MTTLRDPLSRAASAILYSYALHNKTLISEFDAVQDDPFWGTFNPSRRHLQAFVWWHEATFEGVFFRLLATGKGCVSP
eukprot:CAMPEP_0206412742 /NCGR_PEP_ID=MMETSP0294-20121207/34215_1 /ASSEMBLY_ACC=CAM_ASM_000327 /TAXON_ID=39354 /ORGANISM="Heterosigma akashiwo, Strain CCMP2393" /LENGTH=77 /DNA_ID=CAMNT_0053874029 /DNA_START=472 /DNA_END=701 /DNA_ORIENTATION=+